MATLRIEITDNKVLTTITAFLQSLNIPCEVEEDVRIPNKETLEAIQDAESGRMIKFSGSKELIAKLREL